MRKLTSRLFLAALGCVAFSGACGSDDPAPVTPVNYVPVFTLPGGARLGDSLELRCDNTLAVGVAILREAFVDEDDEYETYGDKNDGLVAVETENQFRLLPANACGTAARCGYIRLEGLDAQDQVLATTDTSTTEGVLVFKDAASAASLTQLRASLMHGTDRTPFVNPDESNAASTVAPKFALPAEPCTDDGTGGAPNEPVGGASAGGAGGQTAEGGFGGALGGAGGESLGGAPSLPLGGAGAGGA